LRAKIAKKDHEIHAVDHDIICSKRVSEYEIDRMMQSSSEFRKAVSRVSVKLIKSRKMLMERREKCFWTSRKRHILNVWRATVQSQIKCVKVLKVSITKMLYQKGFNTVRHFSHTKERSQTRTKFAQSICSIQR
jgi:hypothetical protein